MKIASGILAATAAVVGLGGAAAPAQTGRAAATPTINRHGAG